MPQWILRLGDLEIPTQKFPARTIDATIENCVNDPLVVTELKINNLTKTINFPFV